MEFVCVLVFIFLKLMIYHLRYSSTIYKTQAVCGLWLRLAHVSLCPASRSPGWGPSHLVGSFLAAIQEGNVLVKIDSVTQAISSTEI